jgi:hypothetical protein
MPRNSGLCEPDSSHYWDGEFPHANGQQYRAQSDVHVSNTTSGLYARLGPGTVNAKESNVTWIYLDQAKLGNGADGVSHTAGRG